MHQLLLLMLLLLYQQVTTEPVPSWASEEVLWGAKVVSRPELGGGSWQKPPKTLLLVEDGGDFLFWVGMRKKELNFTCSGIFP
jgi:hypothetical protein